MSPFQILNLSPDASEAEIRTAYLHLVQLYPPARFPDLFSRIADAYAKIDTPEKRMDYKLLGDSNQPTHETFAEEALDLMRFQRNRPSWEKLCELMQK